MIEQKRKNTGRLLLNTGGRAVLSELERLVIELKLSKSDDRHDGQRKKEDEERTGIIPTPVFRACLSTEAGIWFDAWGAA